MDPQVAGAYSGGNAILDRLNPADRASLLPGLSVIFEEEASVLHARGQPIGGVYFPIEAVYSVVVELERGQMYEVNIIGRGGAAGIELALGARAALRTVLCQAPGRVAHIPRAEFMRALDRSPTLLAAVRESLRQQWFESEQTVACNFAHTIEQRAARWILMMQDQTGREYFPLRTEFLSMMLGIPDAKVRAPLAALAELGCIEYVGEELTVISRDALREHVCICYEERP
jgi:CRP-like cAMP-binding protein